MNSSSEASPLNLCPCCGHKGKVDMVHRCASCGVVSVGPPLALPEFELPSYFWSSLSLGWGLCLVLILSWQIFAVMSGSPNWSSSAASLIGAVEIASWRVFWFLLPAAVTGIWMSLWIQNKVRTDPRHVAGSRITRVGAVLISLPLLITATSVLVTVPERLRERNRARAAAEHSYYYALQSALLKYQALRGTLPHDLNDLGELPDPHGSIRELLLHFDPNMYSYSPRSDIASTLSTPPVKEHSLRGAAARMRLVSLSTGPFTNKDDSPTASLPFTGYELVLKSTGDDGLPVNRVVLRDGVVVDHSASGSGQVQLK